MADSNTDRDPLKLLAAEYMEQLREGQRPSIEEYATQHPELAGEIRDLFPTIAVTERLKAHQARSSGGMATLGAARLEQLGDFRLIREIGRGGMGIVFEAEQGSLGRRVAVKVLPRQVLLDEKHLKRFEREARIAANLHHTNIVEVFGVGEQDGFHYYVMQYIRGAGLDAIISRLAKLVRGPLNGQPQPTPTAKSDGEMIDGAALELLGSEFDGRLGLHYWKSVARIGLQAADALNYAHALKTMHRDIKPANLLLDTQGTVWLADFGLAKAAQSDDISLSKDLVGTLRYMAPEQFLGKSDHRSDIYSFGLTLYELLALRPAYAETDHSRLMQRIGEGPPPAPSSDSGEIPRDLETIVFKAISHDINQRYQSAEAMADDLRCFLEDRPISARRVGPVERLARWCRRNKVMASLAGATLFLLLLVAATASIGYVRTKNALQGEAMERIKAEANANLAREALDRMFERFSPSRIQIIPELSVDADLAIPSSPILSKEAAALLEEMLPFYDRLAQQTGNDDKLRAGTAEANRRVAEIRQRLGQFDEAVKAYGRAIALFEEMAPSANPALKVELAQIKNELGCLYTSRRQFSEARDLHLAALALLQADSSAPSASETLRFELARTYYLLGTQERPLPAADPRQSIRPTQVSDAQRDHLAKAVALLNALPTTPVDNPEYQHLLALCYLEGASTVEARSRDDKDGADRAIVILEGLVKGFSGVPDYAYDLSDAYARIHIPRPPIPAETLTTIEDRLGKSLTLLVKLTAEHPDVPDYLAAEARLYDKLGAFYRQFDQWSEAEQNFRKAIAIQSPLVKQFPSVPHYGLWMAAFRVANADALIHRNQPAEARVELEETLAILLHQLEQKPETPRPHDLLSLGYSKLAIALRQLGEKEKADEATQKAEQERKTGRASP